MKQREELQHCQTAPDTVAPLWAGTVYTRFCKDSSVFWGEFSQHDNGSSWEKVLG